jgi:serine/threonine protein kinase
VVTKGQQGWINRPIKSGSGISQAEIEGQRLVPQGKSSFEGKSSIEDEVDTLLQMREALAKEGMPRDWVVNPTKGMYRDTPSGKASFEKMYSMPRIKGKTLGQTDFSKMSKQDRHSLFQQLDDAVNSMHRQGIGHGDLHSGNILISYEKNKPKLTIIDPWPSKDPVYSIGRDHTYLTEHKMQILYPEIGGAPTKLTGKQRDIYMKKLGVNLEDLENYEKLFRYQEKFQGKKTKAIGKQRIKDLTEGNVPPPMRDLKWKEPL